MGIISTEEQAMGEQLVQVCYAVARVGFEPASLWLHGKDPTAIPPQMIEMLDELCKIIICYQLSTVWRLALFLHFDFKQPI